MPLFESKSKSESNSNSESKCKSKSESQSQSKFRSKFKAEPAPQAPAIMTWQCSCRTFNREYAGTATRKCQNKSCGMYWVYKNGKWEDDYHGGKRSYYEPWQTDPNVD